MIDKPPRTDPPSQHPPEQPPRPTPELQQRLDAIRARKQAEQDAGQPTDHSTANTKNTATRAANEDRAHPDDSRPPRQRTSGDTTVAPPAVDPDHHEPAGPRPPQEFTPKPDTPQKPKKANEHTGQSAGYRVADPEGPKNDAPAQEDTGSTRTTGIEPQPGRVIADRRYLPGRDDPPSDPISLEAASASPAAGGLRADQANQPASPAEIGRTDLRLGTPRWSADGPIPTGTQGTEIIGELCVDANGGKHFIGDRIDSWRDNRGRLHNEDNLFATDDNRPPPVDIQAPAIADSSRIISVDGDRPTDTEVRQSVAARAAVAAAKDVIWRQQVEPIADALKAAGMIVDRNSFGSEAANRILFNLQDKLTVAERLKARAASDAYTVASADLVRASERLGVAGGSHAVAVAFPNARVVSGGGTRGPPGTFDRVIFVEGSTPLVAVIEEKGAGATRGTRSVPDPANPAKTIKSEQCSPEYVHDLLSSDPQLAEALRADPSLRVVMQRTVTGDNGGRITCFLVHTSTSGVVTLTEYQLDPHRLRREAIQLPTAERRRT